MTADITKDNFTEYLKNPILFPTEFKEWVSDWFTTNVPKLHVSQIFGFKLQSVKAATDIVGIQSASSASYTSFSTDGPTFSNVPNGFYLLMFGATFGTTAQQPIYSVGVNLYIAPVYDGSTPDDGEACLLDAGTNGRVVLIDLTGGDNDHTITFKYKVTGGATVGVWNRWAYLIKVTTEQ